MGETAKVTISVDKDVKATLEQIALELDLTMSKVARNLIYIGLDDFQFLEKVKLGRTMLSSNLKRFKKNASDCSQSTESKDVNNSDLDLIQISVVIDLDVKEVLEKTAKEMSMPFKMLSANMLYVGLNEINIFRKTGIMRLAVSFRSFMETFRNYGKKE